MDTVAASSTRVVRATTAEGWPHRPRMLDRAIPPPRGWTAATLSPEAWRLRLPQTVLAELRPRIEADMPPPGGVPPPIDPALLPSAAAFMHRLRSLLTDGPGFAVVEGLPLAEWGDDAAIRAYWLLGSLLARPVPTKWDGTMLYEVTDTGRSFGGKVRGSATSAELAFHTDNAFGLAPPDFVGLLCLRSAQSGGISRSCSLYAVHEALRLAHPRLLARLYRPAYYDRQGEHAADRPAVLEAPLFSFDGARLSARLTPNLIRRGHALIGVAMDAELSDALDALEALLGDPAFRVEFAMRPGDLQFLDNHWIAHYRSAFVDAPGHSHKRRMIRVWFRDCGGPGYDG